MRPLHSFQRADLKICRCEASCPKKPSCDRISPRAPAKISWNQLSSSKTTPVHTPARARTERPKAVQ